MNEKQEIQLSEELANKKKMIFAELNKVIVGQEEVIENFLIALFSGGHCLLEGVPGLAKTLLISSLAKVLDMSYSRIQFTPDLMPSDITGTDILAENKSDGKRYFEFIKGPVFAFVISEFIEHICLHCFKFLLESVYSENLRCYLQ